MAYELSWDVAHADRAWHDLESRIAEQETAATGEPVERFTDIVDIDLLARDDKPAKVFLTRDEVRDTYEGFLADPRLEDNPSGEFIRGRVLGQLLHLDLLEGGQVDAHRHIETAMASELRLIDEGLIDDWQQLIEDELARHGLGFDKSYAEDFEERLGVPRNKAAMRRHLIAFARRTGLLGATDRPGGSLIIPEIVEKDAGWVGYFSTDKTGKPFAQLNAHERHGYTRARAAAIAVHEATGHAADFEQKYEAIRRGDMDPIFGITTPQTRENVTAETIALGREQQVLRRVRGRNAWEYHLQADYHEYIDMPWNNALIRINSGVAEDDVVDYMKSRTLPYEKEENIRNRLSDMRDDPTWRANTGAYEPGMRVVRRVMKLSDGQQDAFYQEIGRYPYSEAQMHRILEGM